MRVRSEAQDKVCTWMRASFFSSSVSLVQLSEMFQHLHDVDSGDIEIPAEPPVLPSADTDVSAAFQPSIGPSTHTNPRPTLNFQMKALYEDDVRCHHVCGTWPT